MANNSSPSGMPKIRQTRSESMAIYDSLPPSIRHFMATADIPYTMSAETATKCRAKPSIALKRFRELDFAGRARRIRVAWGPDHPEYLELTQEL